MMKLILAIFALWACLVNAQQLVENLNNIDFEKVLGTPLIAAVNAQGQSAATSLEFIETVAFQDNGNGQEVSNLEFVYKSFSDNQTLENFRMSVPLLTLVNIPFLEIEQVDIEFNVRLSEVNTVSSSSSTNANAEFNSRFLNNRVNFKVEVQSQQKSEVYGEQKEQYNLNVRIRAGQAAMPPGAQRVLSLLDSIIRQGIPEN